MRTSLDPNKLQEAIFWERGRRDRVEFARRCGIGEPDDWQQDLLGQPCRRILMNCCRQSGKSSMAAILALHKAIYEPQSLILCLAPALRQSQELFSKIATFYSHLGESVGADSQRKMGIELANGSRIESLPGSEKTVRSFSGVNLLVLDEAARVDDELYWALRPMLAVSGGSLIMLSTPWGKRGIFYEEWSRGEGWERYEVPAHQCPRISPSFLEEERRALPGWVYKQEYECSFEEAAGAVFSTSEVEEALSSEVQPLFG